MSAEAVQEDWAAFLAERADYFAQGEPDDHPYAERLRQYRERTQLDRAVRHGWVKPLLVFGGPA